MNRLGSFAITSEDSHVFARASGDYNPLHLDPLAARRTRFGQTLIHGVHGTLKAIDLLLEKHGASTELLGIKVKYSRPAMQGQHFEVYCHTSGLKTRLEIFSGGRRCQIIELELDESAGQNQEKDYRLPEQCVVADACADLTIESCHDLYGEVELILDTDLVRSMFPNALRYIPQLQLAVILATTRIVGMRCPGLHSVFAQLNLNFIQLDHAADTDSTAALEYRVLRFDPRIDRVELSLKGHGVQGSIEAFFRSPPIMQPEFARLASLVANNEFSNQHALVIGASRGLGELITKLLAAGGAKVVMTYAAGKEDAYRLSQEIAHSRPAPIVLAYDVLNSSRSEEFDRYCKSITHVYYLASPPISKSESALWDSGLFMHYCRFYIDGLATLLQQIEQLRDKSEELRIFIPSTIFLEEETKGFDEYIAAKAAAEAFVRCHRITHPNCSAYAPRLPQMRTDQTAGIKTVTEQQTMDVILSHLRIASGRAKTKVARA